MVKGLLLLLATSVLEARIITGFLEAADYEVIDYSTLTPTDHSHPPIRFDAAVLVLDTGEANLSAQSAMLRQAAQRENLPIVAVLTQNPGQPMHKLTVLLRPIRLFELVHVIDQAIANVRGARHAESNTLHNQHA